MSVPLSVFNTFDAFSQINPVVKAPTAVLDNGLLLMDSTLILQYFEMQAEPRRKLLAKNPHRLAEDLQLLGFILAASEKVVQNIYEHRLRPAEKQHQPWIERVTQQLLAACHEWDARLAGRTTAQQLDQVMITSTVVWSFIQAMIPTTIPPHDFKHIHGLAEACEALAVFKKYPLAE